MSKQNFDPTHRPPSQLRRNRQHNARDDAWIVAFLKNAQTCTVATSWDDLPFSNVTLFWYDEAAQRIIFHSNIMGRVRANIEHNPKVCISCDEMGKLLPSNAALEFSVQYRSVVVFGQAEILHNLDEARAALYGLIEKYFPKMRPGVEYRPIADEELRQTSVYSVKIVEWSGKENYADRADQVDTWQALSEELLNGGFA